MRDRLRHIDLLRLISMALVMWGHFVGAGCFALDVPGIIASSTPLPLIDASRWSLWKLDVFTYRNLSIQTAVMGVTIFFIVTGYLMPQMLDRYSRLAFLINRVFRIFPVLVVALLAIGLFVWSTEGIVFPWESYLASFSLSYLLLKVQPVAGVLWTLVVEVVFYLVACCVGRFSVSRLLALQAVLLSIVYASTQRVGNYPLMLLASHARYLIVITIGSAIYLGEKEERWEHKAALVLGSILYSYLGYHIYVFGHPDETTYGTVGTIVVASSLCVGLHYLGGSKLMTLVPRVVYKLADLVYPTYLVHAAFGLGTMALVRRVHSGPYFMLACAVLVSVTLAAALHVAVEKPGIALGRRLTRMVTDRGSQVQGQQIANAAS